MEAFGRRLIVVCLIILSALASAEAGRRRHGDPAFKTDLALETFDKAWSIIHETHFDPEFNGVDWVALRDELRPQVEAATSEEQLRSIIRDMLSRLNQSHFALLPRDAVDADDTEEFAKKRRKKKKRKRSRETHDDDDEASGSGTGVVGFQFRLIGEQLVVTDIDDGGAAATAGIRPGWILDAIGDRKFAELLERIQGVDSLESLESIAHAAVTSRLSGKIGSEVSLTLVDGIGQSKERVLERTPPPGESIQFGNLPPFISYVTARELEPEETQLPVGLIHLNVWMVPLARDFDRAMDRFRDQAGIVIDLRGNPGGVGGMVMGISGHFLDERVSLGTFQTRTTTLKFMSNPRRVNAAGDRVTPYTGPVAILIDGLSASTSEVFAGGMQGVGRARVFGTRSAGMALPAMMERLPNDDVLYHAFASFTTPDGAPIEGRGVVPDEEIGLTREDLLTGRDPVLEAAVNWIASEQDQSGGAQ